MFGPYAGIRPERCPKCEPQTGTGPMDKHEQIRQKLREIEELLGLL